MGAFREVFKQHGVEIDVVSTICSGPQLITGRARSGWPGTARLSLRIPDPLLTAFVAYAVQATARGPMGKNKRDHISEILYSKDVAA